MQSLLFLVLYGKFVQQIVDKQQDNDVATTVSLFFNDSNAQSFGLLRKSMVLKG